MLIAASFGVGSVCAEAREWQIRSKGEQLALTALDGEVQLSLKNTTLNEVFRSLQKQMDVNLLTASMDSEMLDRPVSINVSRVKLRSALTLLLQPMDLTYEVRDSAIRIFPVSEYNAQYDTRIYDVAALLDGAESAATLAATLDAILGSPELPSQDFARCRIGGFRNLLIVSGNRVHRERVTGLLDGIESGLNRPVEKPDAQDNRKGN
jgi:hypothetical protein